ncbi:MAG: hypothetical protein OIN86_07825 [Candidatus Methanoperedens sp.]|nr:hypothetical protein [Candidatus Methanoperedens sp.]CAG0976273.1 hypothetical protein METP1_01521 [Methanosarcinales archaeon]
MLKRIADNESGITYTLEAIIGILLIIGTIIYMTGNMPYTAQKTGEHSKVQLMNIGRDSLDLTFITPIYETCPNCNNFNVAREYLLCIEGNPPCINNTFIQPNQIINFTVYYKDGTPVNKNLTLQVTNLGTGNPFENMTKIYNIANWSWLNSPQNLSEFSVQANDFSGGVSNIVTVKVGWYFLDSKNGNYGPDNTKVNGTVDFPNGTGAPDLNIFLNGALKDDGTLCNSNQPTTTDPTGNFSFDWPSSNDFTVGGLYYIVATDSTGHSSNRHMIIYTEKNNGELSVYDQHPPLPSGLNEETTIWETSSAYMHTDLNINIDWFNVNNVQYVSNSNYSITNLGNGNFEFTAYLAGDYYIYVKQGAQNCNGEGPAKTNGVLIHVLPLVPATGKNQDHCVNATELNTYMLRYMPAYVNYNMYLIGPTGNKFTDCPDFKTGEVINGYPTAEAVAVSKLAHIVYPRTGVDNIVEYRMVLWYK